MKKTYGRIARIGFLFGDLRGRSSLVSSFQTESRNSTPRYSSPRTKITWGTHPAEKLKENTGCASSIFDGLPFPQDLDFECPRGAKSVYPGSSPPAPAPQIVAVARAARAGPRERKCAKAWCAADYHGDPRARGGAHAVSVPPSGTSLPHPLGLSLSLSLSLARAHGVNETLTSFSFPFFCRSA